jgi:CHAT domain-containing protein/tetratricopeptide (TPR) repeat protein
MRKRLVRGLLSSVLLLLVRPDLPAQQLSRSEAELRTRIEAAETLRRQGKTDAAITAYREALTLAFRTYGTKDDLRTVPLRISLAELYMAREQYDHAELCYRQVLAIRKDKLQPDDSNLAESFDTLGDFYRFRGEFGQAETHYQQSLAIHQGRKKALAIARSLRRLAGLHIDRGEFARAEALDRQAVQLLEKERQTNPQELARALNNLAAVRKARGDFREAEELVQKALGLLQQGPNANQRLVAQNLNNLGELYHLTGRYDEAETNYRNALQLQEAKLGVGHPEFAQTQGNLGMLALKRGDLVEAERLLERSLKVLQDRRGLKHFEVAQGLNNLAQLRKATGQFKQAEELYTESLKIRQATLGAEHPEVAASLNSLANLHFARSRYQEAEPLYRECLRIREAKLGKTHQAVAETANNLGILDTALGRYEEAERLLDRALEIRRQRLGKSHPEVAQTLSDLAVLARVRGQHDKAEQLYRQSLALFDAALPQDHPNRALTLGNLAFLHASCNRWQESAEVTDKARHIVRRHIQDVLPGLSEQEQLQFLETQHQTSFHTALSLGLARRQDAGLVALSTGWLLNGKAVGQQALAERALLARDSQAPEAAAAGRRLGAVRAQLAALSLQVPAAGQETAHRQQLAVLIAQEQGLAKQLGRVRTRPVQTDPWVELEDVRRALPGDAVLIEMARVRERDFTAAGTAPVWSGERYAAWVIPPAGKGPVRLLDLGPATRVDAAVRAVRQELHNALETIGADEARSERRLRGALARAARLVLRPLEDQAGPARRWLLSPDDLLWLLPWAALPLADDSFALEKHAINYLVSGRDVLAEAGQEKPGPSLILADPDYDLKPAAPAAQLRGGGLPRLGPAERLPGTAAEARAIAPRLKAYTGVAPQVFLGRNAQEGVFKKASSPRVVQLATHGFFLDGPSDGSLQNPLLRCGLLLAGANQPARVGEEDGILTGLEIVGADLRGTELVVLSACETGIGQVRGGEGVAGLRQAFQLAGARCVVATLWQIPDTETVPLMTAFFDGLARGQDKADALRAAQLKLLQDRRNRTGSTHPFFWAAFTLTGP